MIDFEASAFKKANKVRKVKQLHLFGKGEFLLTIAKMDLFENDWNVRR